MSKGKGPKKFEDGRQKIDVDYTNADASNSAQQKKKLNSSILTPVFLLFICIPIAFIIYFWKFYDPSNVGEQAKMDDQQVVEVAKDSVSAPLKHNAAATEDDDEEVLSAEEKAAAALAAQEAAEKAAKAEADRVAQKVAEEKAAAEAAEEERRKAEEEEARKQAAIAAEQARKQAAAEEARRQAEAAKNQEQQKQEQQQVVRYHTVQPNETLYRISVNYYGSGDAVGRIKAANGLASNEISVGQTLKLP